MGLSLSLLSSAWVEIFRHNLFNLATNISLNPRDAKMTMRSLGSFKRKSESVSDPVGPNRKNGINLRNCRPERVLVLDRSFSFKDYLVQDDTKKETEEAKKPPRSAPEQVPVFSSPRPAGELDAAAVKLQKVYKSYRTRRNLADCAVVVEELWWKALDFAALKRSSVSFFDLGKPESAVSRWARARTRAAKVGKGLSKDDKAQKLALQHWLEAIDPRHRYGHNLHLYYEIWFQSESSQPFFHWLDIGEGKEVHLEKCPRSRLQRQCIKYLGPKEREVYQVIVENGKLMYRHSGVAVETTAKGSKAKWIFVLSTTRTLYVGQKIKGQFQHSSFLSGGATTAAGRLVAHNGVLEAIWPYSGHYHPTEENFLEFISFLEENHVDLTDVKRCAIDDDYVSMKSVDEEPVTVTAEPRPNSTHQSGATDQGRDKSKPTDEICRGEKERVFHLGERLSCKWTTGAGPRIGCVRDYPVDLQTRALEQVNLSPRLASGLFNYGPVPSPRPSPKIHLSPRLAYMGLPSPRTPVPTAAN